MLLQECKRDFAPVAPPRQSLLSCFPAAWFLSSRSNSPRGTMQHSIAGVAGPRALKRTAPAAHALVERFDSWALGICGLVVLAAASLAVWLACASQPEGSVGASSATVWSSALVSLRALACPLFSLRPPPCSLRWDGQAWHLGPASSVGAEPWPVQLDVHLDLGAWMLLRVRSTAAGFPRAFAWLPLHRRGMPLQWHGLRCALFAPLSRVPMDGGAGRA